MSIEKNKNDHKTKEAREILVRGLLGEGTLSLAQGKVIALCSNSSAGQSSFLLQLIHNEANFRSVVLDSLQKGVKMDFAYRSQSMICISGLPKCKFVGVSAPRADRKTLSEKLNLDHFLFNLFLNHGERYCTHCEREGRNVRIERKHGKQEIQRQILDLFCAKPIKFSARYSADKATGKKLAELGLSQTFSEDGKLLSDSDALPIAGTLSVLLDEFDINSRNEARILEAIELALDTHALRVEIWSKAAQNGQHQELAHYPLLDICPACLSPAPAPTEREQLKQLTFGELSLGDLLDLSAAKLLGLSKLWRKELPEVKKLNSVLNSLAQLGLGTLTLARKVQSLSGGERLRIEVLSAFIDESSPLLLLLDEPGCVLSDVDLNSLLQFIKDKTELGHTCLFSSRSTAQLGSIDITIEDQRRQQETADAYFPWPPISPARGSFSLSLTGVPFIKDVKLHVRLGAISFVCGASGTGKSTLLFRYLAPAFEELVKSKTELFASKHGVRLKLEGKLSRIVAHEESFSPAPHSSIVVTFLDIFSPLRDHFARLELSRMRGLGAKDFKLPADRISWSKKVLDIRYRGYSLAELFGLSLESAFELLRNIPGCAAPLTLAKKLGLGSLLLSQELQSLSLAELQRLRLASELRLTAQNTIFLLDRPCAGLGKAQSALVCSVFMELLSQGNTLLVIEHNPYVVGQAPSIITLS